MTILNRRLPAALFSALALAAIIMASAPARAALQEQIMIQLSSDRSSDLNVLSALIDPSSSVAKGLSVSVVNGGQVTKQERFSIAQIASAGGAVLASENGMAAVILQGHVDPVNGGQARIRYLTNALSRTYAECKAAVHRSKDGRWNVVNAYTGQVVAHAHVKTWTLGISAIEGLCPGRYFVTPEEQEAALREWRPRHRN